MEDFQRRFIQALFAYLVQRGVEPGAVAAAAGISWHALNNNQPVIFEPERINDLWKQSVRFTQDPQFGLHFGESMQLAALGIIGQIVQSSGTVGEALHHAAGMTSLITDIFHFSVIPEGEYIKITLSADAGKAALFPHVYRQMGDYLLVFLVHELDGLLLRRIEPRKVFVPYPIPDEPEYYRIFRCAARTAGEWSLVFDAGILNIPVLTANHEWQQFLLQQVGSMAPPVPHGTLHARIYQYLLMNSGFFSLTLEGVAANFNMSMRSLQRKLKEEGVTFLEIVNSVRQSLAIAYLETGQYQNKDIAFMLGYNEQSAFLRAFRRWTGDTPAAFRKQLKKHSHTQHSTYPSDDP